MKPDFGPLVALPTTALRTLAELLVQGTLRVGSPQARWSSEFGSLGASAHGAAHQFSAAGFDEAKLALLTRAIVAGRVAAEQAQGAVDLVLSGPEAAGIPLADTDAVVQSLFEQAEREVLVVGYVFYDGATLFQRLHERQQSHPGLKVVFCVDIARRPGDTTLESELLKKFLADFRRHHWPWDPLPEIYYDRRALSTDPKARASLHAKCLIVDQRIAVITSANFTPAAQTRNIEAGIILRDRTTATRLAGYFAALSNDGILTQLPSA